ncbi:hypothetical protein PROFUN_02984 [Planoprotostelium fungivorum]|uniref:Uncharacterized protein n=1 Tax=Planoprotostelium fungivorum TaxID=1890364 RepID=A0A2P6NX83_9EUKA|nr:hypothetical protein PROFUN_02984 [Planoprotostelium fungivorum]
MRVSFTTAITPQAKRIQRGETLRHSGPSFSNRTRRDRYIDMKYYIALFVVACIVAAHASNLSDDFPSPPYNFISATTHNLTATLKCPDNCGNPNNAYCLWNAEIQDTCSATYAKRANLAKRACTGGAQGCGPVCYSDGQGGYACGCVSCGK